MAIKIKTVNLSEFWEILSLNRKRNNVNVIASNPKRQLNKCFRCKAKANKEKIIPISLKIRKKENWTIPSQQVIRTLKICFQNKFSPGIDLFKN